MVFFSCKNRMFAWSDPGLTDTSKDFTCGSKRYCKQMTNCEEAKFYLNECGLSSLDGNNDGVPCEVLCR